MFLDSPLFTKLADGSLQCLCCAHKCVIPEGKLGKCRVRGNVNGKPYAPVYGRYTVAIDPIEKKPLYHYLPGSAVYSYGTVGCNFSCQFCQNSSLSMWNLDLEDVGEINESDIGRLKHLTPEKVVSDAIKEGCASIASTYNEPTVSTEFSFQVFKLAKEKALHTIYVTNGYESEECLNYLAPYLDAVNIDLKSFSEDFYVKVLGAHLQPVLDTIRRCYSMGIHTEVTTLVIPQNNDSDEELTKTAEFIASVGTDIPWHVSAYHDAYKYEGLGHTPLKTLQRARDIGKKAGLKYIYMGNVQSPDARITKCPSCGTTLINRVWFGAEVKMTSGKCPNCGEVIPGYYEDAINMKDKLFEVPPELSGLIQKITEDKPETVNSEGDCPKNYIIYATQNGTSKEVAEAIASQISGYTVCDIQQFSIQKLSNAENCIFCVATYGRGAPPASATVFWNDLQNVSELNKTLNIAMVALGSSAYRRTFCGFGKSLEKKLIELGAHEIIPMFLRDEEDDSCDDGVNEWISNLKSKL